MEEDEAGLKIIECLRGRLIAERAASKAAEEDEQLMDSKLKELEAQLEKETKAMKKFEKKLIFLNKKLQYLRIPSQHDQSSENPSDELQSLEISKGKDSAEDSNTDSPRLKLDMADVNGEVDNSMALIPLSICEEQSEVKISSETKARKKIEKKLSFLNKKLQSLRIPSHHDQSSESPSDEFQSLEISNGKDSAADSNTDSTRSKLEMEDVNGEVDNSMALVPLSICEEQSEVKISSETKARKKIEKKLSFLNKKLQSLRIPSQHDQSSESPSDEFQNFEISNGKDSAEDSNTDSTRWKLEMEDVNGEVDNSMALVPLSICEEQSEVKISSENVREVLGTLKHIREEIQRTIQKRQLTTTRQMIQVG